MRDKYFANIWVTHRCNYRCKYCYVKPMLSSSDLSIEAAREILNFIAQTIDPQQELIINFHGGEPTLNFEVIKFIVETVPVLMENKVLFGMTTNGSMLTEDIINYLSEHFKFNLSISIDGDEQTQKANRIPIVEVPGYHEILENALLLQNKTNRVRARMTFDQNNVKDLFSNLKFLIDKGFKLICISPNIYREDWQDEEFAEVLAQLKKVKQYVEEHNIDDVSLYDIQSTFSELSKCTACESYFNFDVDGSIYPCSFVVGDSDFIVGNARTGLVPEKIAYINKVKSTTIHECSDCALSPYCLSARCIFANYATTGDFNQPNLVQCNMINIKNCLA